MSEQILKITGEVEREQSLALADLRQIDSRFQIEDVAALLPGREGRAIRLAGLLHLAGAKPSGKFLGLHGSADNFHASIPLAPVAETAVLIYSLGEGPLPVKNGGPLRFFIPDHAACHTEEIDECANVKFVDHIELTAARGFDNRPQDDQQHAALHEHEESP